MPGHRRKMVKTPSLPLFFSVAGPIKACSDTSPQELWRLCESCASEFYQTPSENKDCERNKIVTPDGQKMVTLFVTA